MRADTRLVSTYITKPSEEQVREEKEFDKNEAELSTPKNAYAKGQNRWDDRRMTGESQIRPLGPPPTVSRSTGKSSCSIEEVAGWAAVLERESIVICVEWVWGDWGRRF
jgi:hypothetical protein